jgi:ORF6N domain
MFRLSTEEYENIRLQLGTTSGAKEPNSSQTVMRSQIVTSNTGRGGRRYLPYAFTEQG